MFKITTNVQIFNFSLTTVPRMTEPRHDRRLTNNFPYVCKQQFLSEFPALASI